MVREEIIDRLVCAKYIFESGIEVLDRGAPYAAGLAVLAFQDAVEMALRAIAEHIHAQIKENAPFNHILDEIEKVDHAKLTHRTALNQLNKARVNFKHLGLAPRDDDVRKFRRDLEGFFPNATEAFFSLDFSSLSLSSLIVHRRTRNWVKNAEDYLTEGDYDNCFAACALAVEVFQKNHQQGDEDAYRRRMNLRVSGDSIEVARAIAGVAEEVQKQLDAIHQQLGLIGSGISYNDHKQFDDLTPAVMLTGDGRPHFTRRRSRPATLEDALFCTGFARNLILKLQKQYRRNKFAPQPGSRKFLTAKLTKMVVYPPKDGGDVEVIVDIPAGQELSAYGDRRYDKPGHVAIFYQGDCAYVDSEAVKPIEE